MGQSSIVSTDTKIELIMEYEEEGANVAYVDIAQCLSTINRRSYRQGMNFAISSIEVFASKGGNVSVGIVPTTWVADNATTKAFESWKDQRALVLKNEPSLKAKWSDFKIFLDSAHATAGVAGNLTPVDHDANPYTLGDWDVSQYVTPLPGADQAAAGDAKEVTFHVVGDHIPAGTFEVATTTSVGLIKAYAASRALPLAPDPSTQGQYSSGFYNVNSVPDEMQEDVMDNVVQHNDNPPYTITKYPGSELNAPTSQWTDTMILNNFGDSTAFYSDSMGPFVAPLGLLRLAVTNVAEGEEPVFTIVIRCVPGNYKGVLAERGL